MTPERWQQVKDVLHPVLELKPDERAAFLDRACAADLSLRRDVEELLNAEGEVETEFLVQPQILELTLKSASETESSELEDAWIGRPVGPYKIIEQIGVGGMGEVYRAYRADDQYEKQVALKVVRAGQDSGFVLRRFKNERQILASLDHPNIARMHDGGTTTEGIPYFVMELIEGQPIDQYCRQHALPVTQRLQLFLQVCSAVQYAHQRLIIHRDLKPSNILVTSEGTPKLLDFGIAKILDTEAVAGQSESTLTIFRALTPGYASPEQVSGEPITTASDVYSLGVVLYELLTRHHPYRKRNSTPQEVARAACEVEVEKPSVAAHRIETRPDHDSREFPATRKTLDRPAERLSKRLRGDLDTILLMALRKEPQRRYASIEQFAGDIRRHLESLPVLARTDTFGYRASKFITRHKAGVLASLAVALTVIAGLAVTFHEARIARAQQARAEERFNDVRELANSLMFDVHDSIQDLPGSTPARKLLVSRALRYLDSLARDAAYDPSLQRELATAYEKVGTVQGNPFGANLGDTRGALDSYGKAAVIRQSLWQRNPGNVDDAVGLTRAQRLIAAVLGNRGDATAIPKLQQALAGAEQASQIAPSNPAALQELQASYYLLAVFLDAEGDYRSAAGYLQKELPIAQARLQASPEDRVLRRELGRAEAKAGYALARMGSRAEGRNHSQNAIRILESLAADGQDAESSRWAGMAHWMLGDILLMDGDVTGALHSYRQHVQTVEPLAIADPNNSVLQYDLACARARVGNALALLGQPQRGFVMFNQAIQLFKAQIARDPAYVEPRFCLAATYIWEGEALIRSGQRSPALQSYRQGLAGWEPLALNNDGTGVAAVSAGIHVRIGYLLARMDRRDGALQEYRHALDIVEPIAAASPDILEARYVLADVYSSLAELSQEQASNPHQSLQQQIRHWDEARTWYRRSLQAWQQINHPGARTPVGFSCGDPKLVQRKIAQTDAALSRLSVH